MPTANLSRLPLLERLAVWLGLLRRVPVPVPVPVRREPQGARRRSRR